jgi:hypothetical protein
MTAKIQPTQPLSKLTHLNIASVEKLTKYTSFAEVGGISSSVSIGLNGFESR